MKPKNEKGEIVGLGDYARQAEYCFEKIIMSIHIPTSEIQITFARSGGKGGQNVNKTATKAILHWSVGRSRVLSPEQKERVRAKLANKINLFKSGIRLPFSQKHHACL